MAKVKTKKRRPGRPKGAKNKQPTNKTWMQPTSNKHIMVYVIPMN